MKNLKNKSIYLSTYLLLLILLLLIVICFFIVYHKNIDGFDSETDYLAPSTDVISDELWTMLFNKMSKVITKTDPEDPLTLDNIKQKFTNSITKAEINYYVQNSVFPWNQYVTTKYTDYIKKNIQANEEVTGVKTNVNINDQVTSIMKQYSNRYAYKNYLTKPEFEAQENLNGKPYLAYSNETIPTTATIS